MLHGTGIKFTHSYYLIYTFMRCTFRFTLSKDGDVLSFRNLQEVQDSILTHHAPEVHVIHLRHTHTYTPIRNSNQAYPCYNNDGKTLHIDICKV